MMRIEQLSFRYGTGVEALAGVSLDVQRGNVFALLGESGSGKTTLLQCIGRFLRPTSGRILLDDKDIQELDEVSFRRLIGIVFQDLHLFPHLSVLDNLTLAPRHVLGHPPDAARRSAREMLERLAIARLSREYPAQISGGQAQRVAIARSLMLRPEFLLLDEPTSALDSRTTEEFARWLLELSEETTFVVVTHDVPFARQVASSGAWLSAGRLVAQGSIAAVTEQVAGPSPER